MIKLPIRQLVELIMRSGDINSRYFAKDIMLEGAKAHRILQKTSREIYADYRSEVALRTVYTYHDVDYRLEGRADGIFMSAEGTVIEEIKTTLQSLKEITADCTNPAHWAQAKCYAYIYATENDLEQISVQLTYFNLETHESKQFSGAFKVIDLEKFLYELMEKYAQWAGFSASWEKSRNRSIKALDFPFAAYRKGQRELAVNVYRTIRSGRKLFAQAPTGTGKTISVLFPAVKAIGEGQASKIFYLTAKTITRQVAEEAFKKMRGNGLEMKTVTLTAKEKICFLEKPICQPEICQYAKGHYDRVNKAILDTVAEHDDISRDVIEQGARKHTVCPFELSLDIAILADAVICDYNYVFDPRAYLRRFFNETGGDYVILIDEAHNLVDRSREMFSAQLCKTQFYQMKKDYKGKSKALDKILNSINKMMIEFRNKCENKGYLVRDSKQTEFINVIQNFTLVCERMLKEYRELSDDNKFMQLYFDALNFLTIDDFYDERYVTYVETRGNEVSLKLLCLDPSYLLGESLKRGNSTVMFSATLSPLPYYREILGGREDDQLLSLDSPFENKRLCVMLANRVSTKYHDREQSKQPIVRLIRSFMQSKVGNYMIYFPSYQYMDDIYHEFIRAYPDVAVLKQETVMTEQEREHFLAHFQKNPSRSLIGFCVLGGIFSEGIDLKGSRLIGAAIVSVGLPQLSVQQNIIRDYFNHKNGLGFEYAYMYPGMNKVQQAAGRVIRSESDVGAVLLIDERFSYKNYMNLFPKHWNPTRKVHDFQSLEKALASFWGHHRN